MSFASVTQDGLGMEHTELLRSCVQCVSGVAPSLRSVNGSGSCVLGLCPPVYHQNKPPVISRVNCPRYWKLTDRSTACSMMLVVQYTDRGISRMLHKYTSRRDEHHCRLLFAPPLPPFESPGTALFRPSFCQNSSRSRFSRAALFSRFSATFRR